MKLGEVAGLYVGQVEEVPLDDGKVLRTAINKKPVDGHRLEAGGFVGDESSEVDHHTPDKDVHFFAAEHYPTIAEQLGLALPRPTFGENVSSTGFTEADIFVGDHLAIGDAILCVTQPTERCKTIGCNLGQPKILKIMHQLEICGFYASVIEPGRVETNSPIELKHREQSNWSVLRLHRFMFNKLDDDAQREEAMSLAPLSEVWKSRVEVMHGRKMRGEPLNSSLAEL